MGFIIKPNAIIVERSSCTFLRRRAGGGFSKLVAEASNALALRVYEARMVLFHHSALFKQFNDLFRSFIYQKFSLPPVA